MKKNMWLTIAIAALALSGCDSSEAPKEAAPPKANSATNVTAPAAPKVNIKDEMGDEKSGISLIRRHKDEFNFEFKTEVHFKDGVGIRELDRMGRPKKVEMTFKNGSRMERLIQKDKVVTRVSNKDGRVEREVTRETGKRDIVTEHNADGSKTFWSPFGEGTLPVLYFEDGKTPFVKVADGGGSTYGPFDVFNREGKRIYSQTVTNNYGDRSAQVNYYRADGNTVWFEQTWVFPKGEPVLRQAREYNEDGKLIREVLPSTATQPDSDENAQMGVRDFSAGTAGPVIDIPGDAAKEARKTPGADAKMPTDSLTRLLSRPTPNMRQFHQTIQNGVPDEAVLDKLLKS